MKHPRRPRLGDRVPSASDVIERSAEAGEHWARRYSPRVQVQLMIGGGMLLTAIAWSLSPYAREILAIDSKQLTVLVFSPVVLGPGMLVYGLLRAFLPIVPTAAPGSHFGNVLAEADAEQRWRHRLLAIASAIVHLMVYFAMS